MFYGTPPIVTNGLVLNLDAANRLSYPTTGTTWTDLSGFGNNGTLTNGPTYNPNNSGSVVFDGADDYVNIGVGKNCNGFSGDFCVSAWVNRSNVGGWGNIIGDWGTQSSSLEWQLAMFNDGNLFFYNGAGQFVFGFPVQTGLGINTWVNVVISRIGSSFKLYVNTKLLSERTNTLTFGSPTGNLNIGVDGDNVQERFGGRISNVLIYKNKGLTESEILQNYNALKGRYGIN